MSRLQGLNPKSNDRRHVCTLHARWGVAQGCNCRSILDAIALLIEAQRPDLAMILVKQELKLRA